MNARWARWSCAAIAAVWGAAAVHFSHRELPPGMRLDSPPQSVPTGDVTFLDDITGADAYGHGFSSHTIFEAMLRNIGAARRLVVLDCHLCTDLHRNVPDAIAPLTPLASQLVDALLAARAATPQLQILVIADPVNDLYGSAPAPELARLRAAGVELVTADLSQLRDRNVLYSPPWRATLKWWSQGPAGGGWLPNPYSDEGPRFTARAWAQLANLKSSDRRVLITDDGHGGLTALVGTTQPAMATSTDTVTGLQVHGPAVAPLLDSELDLAHAFGWRGALSLSEADAAGPAAADSGAVELKWLGEGALREALLEHISAATAADTIDIASESLSDRGLIGALLAASHRGTTVRMVLDPRRSASLWDSGNQTVASELIAASDGHIHLAWYRTHNEQFRAALILIHGAGPTWMATGSASLTRRDLGDYDLALDAVLTAPPAAAPVAGAQAFFDTLWNDRGPPGIEYTADADTWADPSQLRYWAFRLMELLGVSRT